MTDERAVRSAGTIPNSRPAPAVTARAKRSTDGSSPIPSARGMPAGIESRIRSTPQAASSSPRAPPAAASTRLSTRSWRTRTVRPAPRAERTASSRSRSPERTSTRLATLTQAISSTSQTAPKTARIGVRAGPMTVSRIGSRVTAVLA